MVNQAPGSGRAGKQEPGIRREKTETESRRAEVGDQMSEVSGDTDP